ncbi:MAG TPA: hypothetical protein VD758_07015, partial [Gemmatimonadaceae bacterium]|nr:hypothetical protein [Gemmatimonadaceae bacterium]
MRRVLCAVGVLLVFGCAKKEAVVKQETSTAATSATTSQQTTSAAAAAPADARNLLSFYNGALVAVPAQEYGYGQTTFDVIDDDPATTWAAPEHVVSGLSMVFAFPEKTRVEQLSFDTSNIEQEGEGARDVSVE